MSSAIKLYLPNQGFNYESEQVFFPVKGNFSWSKFTKGEHWVLIQLFSRSVVWLLFFNYKQVFLSEQQTGPNNSKWRQGKSWVIY